MQKVEDTLAQRGSRYGEFKHNAKVTQTLYRRLENLAAGHGTVLKYPDAEAMHMVCHKIARVICGTGKVKDNWHDIAGYAKLAEDLADNCNYAYTGDIIETHGSVMMFMVHENTFRAANLEEYEEVAISTILGYLRLMCLEYDMAKQAWRCIAQAAKIAEDLTDEA